LPRRPSGLPELAEVALIKVMVVALKSSCSDY